MILADFRRDFKIGTKERGRKFRDQFLARVSFIAPRFAAKIAVKPRGMARPMRRFMGERRIETLGVHKRLGGRHLDVVGFEGVISAAAAIPNFRARICEESFHAFDALDRRIARFGTRIEMIRQSFNLLCVENRVCLEKRDFAFYFSSVLSFFRDGNFVGVDDRRAFLAFAYVGCEFLRLLNVIQNGAAKPCSTVTPQSMRTLMPE